MLSIRTSASLLLVFSMFMSCAKQKETASTNPNGTCKAGFIAAYNATKKSTDEVKKRNDEIYKKNEENLKGYESASGAERELRNNELAELIDAILDPIKTAQSDCRHLLGTYAGTGECEALVESTGAKTTVKAENFSSTCKSVDDDAKLMDMFHRTIHKEARSPTR